MNGIKTPAELREAIAMAIATEDNYDIIHAIHKYKWYNWYQNIHIKKDSEADVENTKIFEELKENYPEIHKQVEQRIDFEIEKLEQDEQD